MNLSLAIGGFYAEMALESGSTIDGAMALYLSMVFKPWD